MRENAGNDRGGGHSGVCPAFYVLGMDPGSEPGVTKIKRVRGDEKTMGLPKLKEPGVKK